MNNSRPAGDNDSRPAEDVAALKLELELEKLDLEWMEEEERHGSARLELLQSVTLLAMLAGFALDHGAAGEKLQRPGRRLDSSRRESSGRAR